MHKNLAMTIAAAGVLAVAACNQDPAGISTNEMMMAQSAQLVAQDVAAATRTSHERWVGRLLDTLRTTDDPEARALLGQARAYRDSARAAFDAGNREAARNYARLGFRAVLGAIIEIFPNAPARTGAAVDDAITRIGNVLGDREAPRIRAVLAHVQELRAQANAALAADDNITALALNLRGMQILHRLVEHVRDRRMNHDDVADGEMEAVGI